MKVKSAIKLLPVVALGVIAALLTPDSVDKKLQAGIVEAKLLADPYESAMVLTKALLDEKTTTQIVFSFLFDPFLDDTIKEQKQVEKIIGDYLVAAVDRGDKRAMRPIFQSWLDDSVLERSTPFVMLQAYKPNASPEVLLAAARLTIDGRQVQMDMQKAFTFLTRSWLLDQQPLTAVYAREVFLKLQDGPNAYLWSLRTLNESPWPGAWFENDRSPEEKVDIQRQAHDPKVMLIGPSPIKPFEG